MLKRFLLSFLFCLMTVLSWQTAGEAAAERKVAVLPFTNLSFAKEPQLANTIAVAVMNALAKTGRYQFVKADFPVQKSGKSPASWESLTAAAEQAGAELLLAGSVYEVDIYEKTFRVTVGIRLIEVSTGEVIYADMVEGKINDDQANYPHAKVRINYGQGVSDNLPIIKNITPAVIDKPAKEAARLAAENGKIFTSRAPETAPKIGVLVEHSNPDMSQGIGDVLTLELVKTGGYRVIERDKLAAVARQQAVNSLVDPSAAAGLGKALGVRYLLIASLTDLSSEPIFRFPFGQSTYKLKPILAMRMIDTESAGIVFAASAKGEAEQIQKWNYSRSGMLKEAPLPPLTFGYACMAMKNAAAASIDILYEQAPPEGEIIRLLDDRFRINLGKNQHLRDGQILTIYREGEALLHPVTGVLLGKEKVQLGTLRIVDLKADSAECVIEGQVKGQLRIGDKVRPIVEKR